MSEKLLRDCRFCDRNPRCDNCSSIETLKKMLQLFEGKDILVIIVTRNKGYRGYINKTTKDALYLSDDVISEPNVFICLNNIVRFNTMNSITNLNTLIQFMEKINNFMNSTSNINPCCCIDSIVEIIDCFKNTNNKDLLSFTLDTDFNFPATNTNSFTRDQIIKANTNIVFAIKNNRIFIYPACGINSIEIRQQPLPVTQ